MNMMQLADSLPFFLTDERMCTIFWRSIFQRCKEGMKPCQVQKINALRDRFIEAGMSESEACQTIVEFSHAMQPKKANKYDVWMLIEILKENGDLALLDEVCESTLSKMPEKQAEVVREFRARLLEIKLMGVATSTELMIKVGAK